MTTTEQGPTAVTERALGLDLARGFMLLFGYGVAQIVRRQTGTAWATRFLLWRRSAVLVVLGLLHATMLYVGDILGAYGVLLFLGVWAIRWKDRWLLIVAASSSR